MRDGGCHSYSWSCCCKFWWRYSVCARLLWFMWLHFVTSVYSKAAHFKASSEQYDFVSLSCRAGIVAACPGGEILYSSCTLSQIQNLSVVEQAVYLAKENHGIQLQVSQTLTVNCMRDSVINPTVIYALTSEIYKIQEIIWPFLFFFFPPLVLITSTFRLLTCDPSHTCLGKPFTSLPTSTWVRWSSRT